MKRSIVIFFASAWLGVVAVAASGQQTTAGKSYNPAITYPGQYKADLLFFKGAGSDTWRYIPRFERLSSVTCADALLYLKQAGRWKGNLNLRDGSCDTPDEPADWAMGNWLNYSELLLQQQGQQQ